MNYALILGVGGGLAAILLLIGVVTSLSEGKNIVDERIDRYAGAAVFEEPGEQKALLTDWINRRVAKSSFGDQIAKNLARADLKFKPGEFLATFVITGFAIGVLGWFIGGRDFNWWWNRGFHRPDTPLVLYAPPAGPTLNQI